MLVAQSCPTLCNPMNWGLPGSSVRGIFPGKNAGVDSHSLLQGIFPTPGLNPHLPHGQADSLPLSCQGSLPTSWEATKQLSLVPHPQLQVLVPGTLSWGRLLCVGPPLSSPRRLPTFQDGCGNPRWAEILLVGVCPPEEAGEGLARSRAHPKATRDCQAIFN